VCFRLFKKILSFFRFSNIKDEKQVKSKKHTAAPRNKITSTRIGELGEYKINLQLNQLPKECKYLSDIMIQNHYHKSKTGYSQIDHVVISPYGLFVIETKNYGGEIKGNRRDEKWTVSNQPPMYNPIRQNYGHIKALQNILFDFKKLTFVSMISFTGRCQLSVDPELRKIESNELVVYDFKLNDYIERKLSHWKVKGTQPTLSEQDITRIHETIHKANITDPKIRKLHIEKAKNAIKD
jgi:hypothetical protein